MRWLLAIASVLIGVLFIAAAVRAVCTGEFRGPQKIVHGTPTGVATIARRARPLAFWLCVVAYLAFGAGAIVGAWIIG
jgi:hypothetical protein